VKNTDAALLSQQIQYHLGSDTVVKSICGTKAMRMANVLDELARRFSQERNISQREMFEVALIEFFQRYGYRDEVEKYLLE